MAFKKYNINQIPFSNFQVQGPGDKIPRGKKKKKTKKEEQTEARSSYETEEEQVLGIDQLDYYHDRRAHKKIKEDLKKGPIYNPYSLDPEKPISTSFLSQDFMNYLTEHPDYFLYNEPGVQIYDDVNIYATEESKKTYKDLVDKAKAATKTFLTAFPNKKEFLPKVSDTGISGLRDYIKELKDKGNFFVGEYKEAEKYYKARRLAKEEKIDADEFAKQYKENQWSRFDNNTVVTSPEDQEKLENIWYGTPDATGRRTWMDDPRNVVKTAKYATAGAMGLVGGYGTWGPILSRILTHPIVAAVGTGYGAGHLVTNSIPNIIEGVKEDDYSKVGENLFWAGLDLMPFLIPVESGVLAVQEMENAAKYIKNLPKNVSDKASIFKSLIGGNKSDYKKYVSTLIKTEAKLNDKLTTLKRDLYLNNQDLNQLGVTISGLQQERRLLNKKLEKVAETLSTSSSEEIAKIKEKIVELNKLELDVKNLDQLIKEGKLIWDPEKQTITIPNVIDNIFEQSEAIRTQLSGGIDYIVDLQTGEKIPFNIELPNLGLQISKSEVGAVPSSSIYSMNPKYVETLNKNIEFVKSIFPGESFGGSVLPNIGITTATKDIDLITTQKQYDEFVKLAEEGKIAGVTKSQGPQARYGSTWDLKVNNETLPIDYNFIKEGKDGFAEGQLANELYQLYFPDEFYAAASKLADDILLAKRQKLKNFNDLIKQKIKINKTPEELLEAFKNEPEIKSLVDSFKVGRLSYKSKFRLRTDIVLQNADPEIVAKVQEAFTKSLTGSKGSIGYQFPLEKLTNVEDNIKILERIGINPELGLDINKIANDPKRMQVFLNDYYINSSIFNRGIYLGGPLVDSKSTIKDAFQKWINQGGNVEGFGINYVQLGTPGDFGKGEGIKGSTYFDLVAGKNYDNVFEYLNDIERQVEANYYFTLEEADLIKELAKKHNLTFTSDSLKKIEKIKEINLDDIPRVDLSKKDLIEHSTFHYYDSYESHIDNKIFSQNLGNFYKDLGESLGMRAVTKTLKETTHFQEKYSSILGNIREDLDEIKYAMAKDLDDLNLKSRSLRFDTLKHYSKRTNLDKVKNAMNLKSSLENFRWQEKGKFLDFENEMLKIVEETIYREQIINSFIEGSRKSIQNLIIKQENLLKEKYIKPAVKKIKSESSTVKQEVLSNKLKSKEARESAKELKALIKEQKAEEKIIEKEIKTLQKLENDLYLELDYLKEYNKKVKKALFASAATIGWFEFAEYIDPRIQEEGGWEMDLLRTVQELGNLIKKDEKKSIDAEKVVNTKKYGGALNTFNYQQNKLSLPDNMPSDEIYLSPEEIQYYRSLGYDVEELD